MEYPGTPRQGVGLQQEHDIFRSSFDSLRRCRACHGGFF